MGFCPFLRVFLMLWFLHFADPDIDWLPIITDSMTHFCSGSREDSTVGRPKTGILGLSTSWNSRKSCTKVRQKTNIYKPRMNCTHSMHLRSHGSKDVVARHGSKVYGKAAIGAPPMSVPCLQRSGSENGAIPKKGFHLVFEWSDFWV